MTKMRLTPAQKSAVAEWQKRTRSGETYAISDVFPAGDNADNVHIRAMHRLRFLGLLQPGIPGGNPLREVA